MSDAQFPVRFSEFDPLADVVRIAAADRVDCNLTFPAGIRRLFVTESHFSRCNFFFRDLTEANFGQGEDQSSYLDCTFDGSTFRSTAAGRAVFERCSFKDVRITYMLAQNTEFVDCVFSGLLQEVSFWGSSPLGLSRRSNRFTGNDFSGANLVDCAFRGGIDLTSNTLPVGSECLVALDGPGALRRAERRARTIGDVDLRERVLGVIRAQEILMAFGQRHLWMRRTDLQHVMDGALSQANRIVFDLVAEESAGLLHGC